MSPKYLPFISFLRSCATTKRRLLLPFTLLSSGFINSESYFPELPQKSKVRIFGELLLHIFKYGSIEWNYFSYGLDIKGLRDSSDYLDDNWFLWKASILNSVLPGIDKTCILRDKSLFSAFLQVWGFDSPRVLGVMDEQLSNQDVLYTITTTPGHYFVKPIKGSCGRRIFDISISEDKTMINGVPIEGSGFKDEVIRSLSGGSYIVQDRVEQHPILNQIYDKSVNTIRLVTVYDKKSDCIIPFSAVLRVGSNDNIVDNWAAGGLAIGIDIESGKLKEYGFFKHGKGTKTLSHPNSGVFFKGIELPFFQKAIKDARKLHRHLLPIFVIGWDIAITSTGVVFIEGNDDLEIAINQEANGGLKRSLLKYL